MKYDKESAYPDDIRMYDDNPRSPFYSGDPDECPECGGSEFDEELNCVDCGSHLYSKQELDEIYADIYYDMMKDERG